MVTLLVCIVSLSPAGTILSTVQSKSIGNITGVVLDAKGGRIVGATVVARNKDTTRKLQTDHAGRFEVKLPRGLYEVSVTAYLFRPLLIERVQVERNATTRLEIRLEVEEVKSGPPL